MTRFATTFIAFMILPLAVRADSVIDATLANDIGMLRSALASNVQDVNTAGANGTTALHIAAAYGYDEIAAELLAAGALTEARDHLGNTPLILAAQSGQLGTAELLLGAGADPTARSIAGGTALNYARGYGHRELVDALAPVAPTPSPMRQWPWILGVLAIAMTAAVLTEIHHSTRPTPALARAAR